MQQFPVPSTALIWAFKDLFFIFVLNVIVAQIDSQENKQNNDGDNNKSETSAPFTKLVLYKSGGKQEHYEGFAAADCEGNCLFLMPNEAPQNVLSALCDSHRK